MNSITNLTPQQLRRAANIQEKVLSLQKELSRLLGTAESSGAPASPKKRKMSAAGRAAIAAAARARWAKIKGTGTAAPAKPKRKISEAGRAKLAALARARWKKSKALGKTTL